MDQMYELQMDPTNLLLQYGTFDTTGLNQAAPFISSGIYVLPYVAPVNIDNSVTDSVEVTYDGVERIRQTVPFNVFQ